MTSGRDITKTETALSLTKDQLISVVTNAAAGNQKKIEDGINHSDSEENSEDENNNEEDENEDEDEFRLLNLKAVDTFENTSLMKPTTTYVATRLIHT